jgi:hypothetical protein
VCQVAVFGAGLGVLADEGQEVEALVEVERPPDLRKLAGEALTGARGAAEVVQRLRGIVEVRELDWGPPHDPIIDLARSTEPGQEKRP